MPGVRRREENWADTWQEAAWELQAASQGAKEHRTGQPPAGAGRTRGRVLPYRLEKEHERMSLDPRLLASRKLWDNEYRLSFEATPLVAFGHSSPKKWRNEYIPPLALEGSSFLPMKINRGHLLWVFTAWAPESWAVCRPGIKTMTLRQTPPTFPQQPHFPIFANGPPFCSGIGPASFTGPFSSVTTWTSCTWNNALRGCIQLD